MSPVIADGRFTVQAIRESGFEIALDSTGKVRVLSDQPLPQELRGRLKKHLTPVVDYLTHDQQSKLTHLNFITYTASVFERTRLAEVDEDLEAWCRRMRPHLADNHQEKANFYLALCQATREPLETPALPPQPTQTDLPAGWE